MAIKITMPRLSDTMTEGTVATWLKKVGDTVKEGDILAEIETDKATMEFESFNAGTLLHIGIPEGETAPVEGNFSQTSNEYRIMVYHRPFGSKFDKLIAVKRINFPE